MGGAAGWDSEWVGLLDGMVSGWGCWVEYGMQVSITSSHGVVVSLLSDRTITRAAD